MRTLSLSFPSMVLWVILMVQRICTLVPCVFFVTTLPLSHQIFVPFHDVMLCGDKATRSSRRQRFDCFCPNGKTSSFLLVLFLLQPRCGLTLRRPKLHSSVMFYWWWQNVVLLLHAYYSAAEIWQNMSSARSVRWGSISQCSAFRRKIPTVARRHLSSAKHKQGWMAA